MARNEPNECGVCSEEFDEGARCPRILECFHHLCSHCIHQLIKNNRKMCPFCRKEFQAASAADIKVNQGVLELVKYLSEIDLKARQVQRAKGTQDAKGVIHDFKQLSSDVNSRLIFECQQLQDQTDTVLQEAKDVRISIQQENTRVETQILPKMNVLVSRNKTKVQQLQDIEQKLRINLTEFKNKHTQLQNMKGSLETAYTRRDVASAVVQAEDVNASIDALIKPVKEAIPMDNETLKGSKKELQATNEKVGIVEEILNFCEGDKATKTLPNLTSFVLLRSLTGHITGETLRSMKEPVKNLIAHGKLLAVIDTPGKTMMARMSISAEKLHLHYFKETFLLSDNHLLQYQDVLNLEEKSPRLTFLDLSTVFQRLGRVYIRLQPESQRSKHFSFLCTGELGPSYANTKIDDVWLKESDFESLRGGGCLLQDLKKDHALPDIGGGGESLQDQQEPWMAGTVEGLSGPQRSRTLALQFVIRTRNNPDFTCPFAFGKVEEGLDVVKVAILSQTEGNPVFVRDCGIVLSPFMTGLNCQSKQNS